MAGICLKLTFGGGEMDGAFAVGQESTQRLIHEEKIQVKLS